MTNQERQTLEQIKVEYSDWQQLPGQFIKDEIASRVWWESNQDCGRLWTDLKCGDCGVRIVSGQFANTCADCYARLFKVFYPPNKEKY